MPKLFYLYDSETGNYTGEYLAQRCPVTKESHLSPTYSTDIKPPKCKENEYPVFDGAKWIKRTVKPVETKEPPKEDPAKVARYMRDQLLRDADIAINKLEDCGKDAKLLREHREKLRNVPQQDGFPNNIDWPSITAV